LGKSLFDLSGKVAVVIGGTTGIGHALSLGLADAGADVIASSRRSEEVEKTAAELEAKGRRSLRLTSDVKDRASIVALRDRTLAEFGKVDILINCAGTTKRGPTLTFGEDDWNHILETNLTGTLRGCQVFGETMLAAGYGRIVNIASLSTFVALNEVAAYAASKAAVASLTKSLAVVFRTDLNTKLLDETGRGKEFLLRTPMGRFGKTDELVGAAIYLASDAASFVAGEVITVDGGFLASGVNQ
jgi:NAD(P)-dependent dehydrogenase (short-subunit alcohol dehydrogenase family)